MVAVNFNNLNTEQKKAVMASVGPSIILAGAGSGKTRVLVSKVIYLISVKKVDPQAIVMITFTNKAASEMKTRMQSALGTAVRLGFIGTFHSFCVQILRHEYKLVEVGLNFVIYDDDDQQQVIKEILNKQNLKKYTPGYYQNRISAAKNQLITPERYLDLFSDYGAATVAAVYFEYQKLLTKNNAFDFDDLIMKTVQIFIKYPDLLDKYQSKYKHLLIDEFHDTNYAQYKLAKLLAEKYENITVVGDFSQSIYSWRGADIRNLEKFQSDFPKHAIFHLSENYRSTQKILDFAHRVISKNQTHPVLALYTKNKEGVDIVFYEAGNEENEALYITSEILNLQKSVPLSSFAVLYRTNAQSRIIEEAFLHEGLPYMLVGGTRFYERREVKDILSYLRLLVNPVDSISLERIKKIGKKRFSHFKEKYEELKENTKTKSTNEIIEDLFAVTEYLSLYNPDDEEDFSRLENIRELKSVAVRNPDLVTFLEQVALVEAEYFAGEKKKGVDDGVRLMTLHQAKGLEFSTVFIAGVEEGILPHSRSVDDYFQLEEERRLFYVGITRAKEKLYITHANSRFIFGRRNPGMKSRFIMTDDEAFSLS